MAKTKNKIKYFAYVRKSTEGEERQAMSIESQKDRLREFKELDIVEVFEEKRSAFKPYNRPVFEEIVKRIHKGEAGGVIAWHPDRLSRNEIDASTVTYLVRTGVIEDLKFGSYNFDNSPEGIMMLQLALSQSQYFSSKLGKDVKRGIQKKFEMGWQNGPAPEGYINNRSKGKGLCVIAIDKKRFPLLRQAFDLLLTGNYTAPKVLDILNNEWGYRTIKHKKRGGGPLSRTGFYRLLTNQFYAGIIKYNGIQKEGKHKPIITLKEYDRIQEILGTKGKPRPKKHEFAFSGLIKCKKCGCVVVGETKRKYIKKSGQIKEYTYYHCTHKKKDIKCQERSIEEKKLEEQVMDELSKYEILPSFKNWAIEILKEENNNEIKERTEVHANINDTILKTQAELDELTKMRYRELIDDEAFITNKNNLQAQIARLRQELKNVENRADHWVELTEKVFNFACYARKAFDKGTMQEKKEIVSALGSNRKLFEKNFSILAKEWFEEIGNRKNTLQRDFVRLEPIIFSEDKNKNEAVLRLRSDMRE